MIFTGFNSSTWGFDSSTALEFVRTLRIETNLVRNATIVSIYQAGESLSEIFNKVWLLYKGRMIYFGPVDLARQYFIDIGYVPAARQTTPDFLVSVTNALGRIMATTEYDEIRSSERSSGVRGYYQNSEIKKINQALTLPRTRQILWANRIWLPPIVTLPRRRIRTISILILETGVCRLVERYTCAFFWPGPKQRTSPINRTRNFKLDRWRQITALRSRL